MLTIIGLGAGDVETLSRGAERALREHSGRLLLRTARHPVVDALREWGIAFDSLDALYQSAADFTSLYPQIASAVLDRARQGDCAFAVPGHPLFAEEAVRQILEQAQTENLPTQIVTSGSFVEASLTAVGASLGDGCDVRDALTLPLGDSVGRAGERMIGRLDVTRGVLLYQVFDQASASHAKLALMRDYPDDWRIAVIQQAGVAGKQSVGWLPLYQLDRQSVDHLTSVYVPPLPASLRRPDFATLAGIMARLRAPDGCPWDREQSHESLRKYVVEETYEVVEAIESGDPDWLSEELGDLLLQVVFHAQLATEDGVFTLDDVLGKIVDKLVRRHPHVFGEIAVADSAEVLRNWEAIKRAEKADSTVDRRESLLDGVPNHLPALMRAMEISKRVVKVGFEWDSFADVLAKFDEESAELKAELSAGASREKIASELGDLLFTLVQIARWQKIDPEDSLRQMLRRFTARFQHIEKRAAEMNRNLPDMTLAEMDALWDEAKEQGVGQCGKTNLTQP
jgi:tetrapyrrole methylase family protein / MazG family protein